MQISSRFTIAIHIFACINTFEKEYKITSDFLASSVNANPVIIRKLLQQLKAAGLVTVQRGSGGASIAKPLEEELSKGDVAMVFGCGPTPMLKAVVECCKAAGVPSQVSLEQRMGCGVGACVVCACTVIRGGRQYVLRVCKDGPVFKGEEVVL